MAKVTITTTAQWEVPDDEAQSFASEFEQFANDSEAVEQLIHSERRRRASTGTRAKIVKVSGCVLFG